MSAFSAIHAETEIFQENFSQLKEGPLLGQEGWDDYNPGPDAKAVSPMVVTGGPDPAPVYIGQTESGADLICRGKQKVPLHELQDATKIILEFDISADSEAPIALFGVGNSANCPPRAGIFNSFIIREQDFGGRIHQAYGPDGKLAKPNPGDWYRVRSEWNFVEGLGAWTGTLAIKNLTLEETEFTPLSFDKQGKQKVTPVGLFTPPGTNDFWNMIFLRTGTPSGRVANIRILVP